MQSPKRGTLVNGMTSIGKGSDGDVIMIGPYVLSKTLGEGSYASVKLGTHRITGEKAAIKLIDKSKVGNTARRLRRIMLEVDVLKAIMKDEDEAHPNITKLIDFLETEQFYVLVIEYVAGRNLYQVLKSRIGTSEELLPADRSFGLFYQLVSGLEFCHDRGVAHRDIKPENVLVDEFLRTAKLTDFGMANFMKGSQLLETSCGSPHYAAPEVIRGEKYNGKASDVWSLGVVLYALCSGRLPFVHPNIPKLLEMIQRGEYEMQPHFDELLRNLIANMLHPNAKKRLTLADVKKHAWWTSNCRRFGLEPQGIYIPVSRSGFANPLLMLGETSNWSSGEESAMSFQRTLSTIPSSVLTPVIESADEASFASPCEPRRIQSERVMKRSGGGADVIESSPGGGSPPKKRWSEGDAVHPTNGVSPMAAQKKPQPSAGKLKSMFLALREKLRRRNNSKPLNSPMIIPVK